MHRRLFACPSAVKALSVCTVLGTGMVMPTCLAQTFPAITGTIPVFRGDMVPSALPAHHKKTDTPVMYARIRDGVYSVDGMVGKVRLNYDVQAAAYFYLFMPGVGTALVSLTPSKEAVSIPAAYKDGELTVKVAEHTFDVTGVESLVNDQGKEPATLYVSLNRSAWKLNCTPMLGFGNAGEAPYQWPGALRVLPAAATQAEEEHPPVPASLLPKPAALQTSVAEAHSAQKPPL